MLALTALTILAGCSGGDDAAPTSTAPSTTAPTSTAPTTSTTVPSSAELVALACSDQLVVRDAGQLPADLTSVSGLAASRRDAGVVWAVEDSFEPADLVALGTDGRELGRVQVRGGPLTNLDWEDLAITVDADGTPQVYVADIGDNLSIRPSVQLYVFDEPEPATTSVTPRVIVATYRALDGSEVRPNAEALVVQGDTVWVLDKEPDGPATLYRLEPTAEDPDRGVLAAVATLDLPGEQVSGADLSPDGTVLAVRTTDAVRLYPVPEGADIAAALGGEPCTAPTPPEAQGESIAVLPGTDGLLTVSEAEQGGAVTLHRLAPR